MLAAPPAKKYANAKFLLHAVLILWLFHGSGRQPKLHLLVRGPWFWTGAPCSHQRTWAEKDGPPVHPPTRRSFGTRMIETLGKQLDGNANLDYQPTGFVYALDVPLSSLKPPD